METECRSVVNEYIRSFSRASEAVCQMCDGIGMRLFSMF
jgi:hypothetical protein